MQHSLTPYFLGLLSNLCFGTASITFSQFSKRFSATWVNQLKVSLALVGFLVSFILFESYTPLSFRGTALLLSSGLLGLCIGDFFLFRAFASLGAARTLILYSFQPFLLGVYGYLALNQTLSFAKVCAIGCMIACIATFLHERRKAVGHFDLKNFSYAFIGILLDAGGVMLTREAYEGAPELEAFQANFMRALGALFGFFLIAPRFPKILLSDLKSLGAKERNTILLACFFGTIVSLSLYLSAVKTAHLATLTAISITSPLWASVIEHVQLKRWPERTLWVALVFFILGFVLIRF